MKPKSTIYVVDDEEATIEHIRFEFETLDRAVKGFASAELFLKSYDDSGDDPRCLILCVELPGMNGPELQDRLGRSQSLIPIILLTGNADIPTTVKSIQNGAVDVLKKPYSREALLRDVERGLAIDAERRSHRSRESTIQKRLDSLTKREQEVLQLLKNCKSNKQIAAILHIGYQTAARHRSRVFRKLDIQNEMELTQLWNRFDAGLTDSIPRELQEIDRQR